VRQAIGALGASRLGATACVSAGPRGRLHPCGPLVYHSRQYERREACPAVPAKSQERGPSKPRGAAFDL